MKNIKHIYSINFDRFKRSPKKIVYVVFHYTGMVSEKKAIDRLADKSSKGELPLFYKKRWYNY